MDANGMSRAALGGLVAISLAAGVIVTPPAREAEDRADADEIDPCADDPYVCWCLASGACPEGDP